MDGWVTIKADLDTKRFDAQISDAERKLEELDDMIANPKKYDMSSEDIEKAKIDAEKLNNKLVQLNANKEKLGKTSGLDNLKNKFQDIGSSLKNVATKSDLGGLTKKVSGIGSAIGGITKSVMKWGLALFGIRTAYNFIRNAANTVFEQNEGLSNQVQFMKSVIATALEPLIRSIVSLVYTLLSFVNSIVTKLTGKNLFAAAKKNLSSGASSAKEIKKQLAGFDEMNVLTESSSGGGGAGGGGADTSGWASQNDALMKVLEDYRKLFESGDWAGIGKKISQDIVSGLSYVENKIKSIPWENIGKAISEFLTNIDFTGIYVGMVNVFGEAVLGLQNMMLAIDWPTIFKNVGTAVAAAFSRINEYIQQIRFEDIGKMVSDTFTAIPWGDIGSSILEALWNSLMGLIDLFLAIDWGQVGKTISDAVHQWINTIIDKFVETDWKKLGEDIVDAIFDFIEGIDWIQLGADILLGLGEGILGLIDFIIGAFGKLLERILNFFGIHSPSTLFADIGKNLMLGLINGLQGLVNSVVNIFKGIVDKIKSVFSTIVNWLKNNVINPIVNLFKDIGTKVGDVISGAFKGVVNGILGAVEKTLNTPIKTINSLITTINKVPGINLGKLQTFNLPRLAKGGIVNMPGRGVPVGNAIGGESGQEGVIPLTDSQQMALLGEAIGKYITINATITNTMNGRVISKELQKIQNENDFAFNR